MIRLWHQLHPAWLSLSPCCMIHRHEDGQQMNGESGSSIRSWARKLDTSNDPLSAVRKAEEEERQQAQRRAQEEEQERLQAQEEEEIRFRAQQEQQARLRAEEERQARHRAEEEQQAILRAEEEQQMRRRNEEQQFAKRRAEEEQQARRRAEEDQLARRRAEQEQQARRQAEEQQQVTFICRCLWILVHAFWLLCASGVHHQGYERSKGQVINEALSLRCLQEQALLVHRGCTAVQILPLSLTTESGSSTMSASVHLLCLITT